VSAERERVDALLAATGMRFTEQALAEEAGRLGARAGWRFTTTEGDVEAEVFVVEVDPEAAAGRLRGAEGDLASHNGPIVFRVRYTGPAESALAGGMRAGTVAGALAGEE
jgi:hypothetical protein